MCGADVRRLRALLTRSVLSRSWHTLPPVALSSFKRAWVTILRGMLEHTAGECFATKTILAAFTGSCGDSHVSRAASIISLECVRGPIIGFLFNVHCLLHPDFLKGSRKERRSIAARGLAPQLRD